MGTALYGMECLLVARVQYRVVPRIFKPKRQRDPKSQNWGILDFKICPYM